MTLNVLRVIIIHFLFITAINITSAEPVFHKVVAQKGDGVYSLLRRYHLDEHYCNIEQFYDLNQLKENAGLKVGRSYYLPVLLYKYNGKSIRSTISDNDWDKAVRIQKYNEQLLTETLREGRYQDTKVLFVPFHELNCEAPNTAEVVAINQTETTENMEVSSTSSAASERELPDVNINRKQSDKTTYANASVNNRHFPIFGEKYAYTPIESNKLARQVYYIIAGHGGPDPGAIGSYGGHTLCEDEYAYDVALRLCRNLIAHGAIAYMVNRDPNDGIREGKYLDCDKDEVLWGDTKMVRAHKPRLFQRSDIINTLYDKHKAQGIKTQVSIAIHVDSRSKNEQTDLFFYYKEGSVSSRNVAGKLHKTMQKKYRKYRPDGRYHGSVSSRDLHMLREVNCDAIYIELGNIRNSFDQIRIVPESNRQALANWLFEGLIN